MAMVGWLIIIFFFFSTAASSCHGETSSMDSCSSPGVRLYWKTKRNLENLMVLDNGIVQVSLSCPGGHITSIGYNGNDAIEFHNKEDNRGYWDIVWNNPGEKRAPIDKLGGTDYRVIMEDESQVEVSFTRTWNGRNSTPPLNVDKRYILRRGSSKIYAYSIFERLEGWPGVDIGQIRIAFKLRTDMFKKMVLSDDRQRTMPSAIDFFKGKKLAYPEAVLFANTTNEHIKGEVDDKYQYSSENRENRVHGWISEESRVGFWMITPSDEFRAGGPIKQELTSHVGPTTLSMFTSTHYAGKDYDIEYRNGDPWKKVFGPVCVYLNSISLEDNLNLLWEDAKDQMAVEVESWPYSFPQSKDFPSSEERATLSGQLLVHDRYMNERLMWAGSAYVGLADPGEVGSWQIQSKGYQFWTQTNKEGHFTIENVRPGNYNLYAWIPGFLGNWKYNLDLLLNPGQEMELGVVVYAPPRNGPTLWEIGIPDRSAAEFFVPDADPNLANRLYINKPTHKFRQYGLWDRYTDLYPTHDLIYTIGTSNYSQDWFFAHVPRKTGHGIYETTTWEIRFELENVNRIGSYTLQLAIASATGAELQVRFNERSKKRPDFTTRLVGRDNAIARHGIHGLYRFYSINVSNRLLLEGSNTIYLTQSRSNSRLYGIMYDYIRFEAPPLHSM